MCDSVEKAPATKITNDGRHARGASTTSIDFNGSKIYVLPRNKTNSSKVNLDICNISLFAISMHHLFVTIYFPSVE